MLMNVCMKINITIFHKINKYMKYSLMPLIMAFRNTLTSLAMLSTSSVSPGPFKSSIFFHLENRRKKRVSFPRACRLQITFVKELTQCSIYNGKNNL